MKAFLNLILISGLLLLTACQNNTLGSANTTDISITKHADKSLPTIKTIKIPKPLSSNAMESGEATLDNFFVKVPAGWASKQQYMNGRTLLFLLAPKEPGYQTNMNILKDPMKGETLNDYINVSLAKMKGMPVVLGNSGDIIANGVSGKYLKYVYNGKERTIIVKSYVFAKDGFAYIITATTLPQFGKRYEPAFDQVANSFKIK